MNIGFIEISMERIISCSHKLLSNCCYLWVVGLPIHFIKKVNIFLIPLDFGIYSTEVHNEHYYFFIYAYITKLNHLFL